MFKNNLRIKVSLLYDLVLSIFYAWSVYQAYVYDAKTRTTGIFSFIIVYGSFTLLVRSPVGVLMMNLLSAVTLPWVFTSSIIRNNIDYFPLQPYLGIFLTIFVAMVQAVIANLFILKADKLLVLKYQYTFSIIVAIVLTVLYTLWSSIV